MNTSSLKRIIDQEARNAAFNYLLVLDEILTVMDIRLDVLPTLNDVNDRKWARELCGWAESIDADKQAKRLVGISKFMIRHNRYNLAKLCMIDTILAVFDGEVLLSKALDEKEQNSQTDEDLAECIKKLRHLKLGLIQQSFKERDEPTMMAKFSAAVMDDDIKTALWIRAVLTKHGLTRNWSDDGSASELICECKSKYSEIWSDANSVCANMVAETSNPREELEQEDMPAMLYLQALTEISKKMPVKHDYVNNRSSYNDKKWVLQLLNEALSEIKGRRPLVKRLLMRLECSIVASKSFVWRICLADDLVSLISEEEFIWEGLKKCNDSMGDCRRTEVIIQELRESGTLEGLDEAKEVLKGFDELRDRSMKIQNVLEIAFNAMKDLKQELLRDYYGGEMPDDMEEFCRKSDDEIAVATELRSWVMQFCSRNESEDYKYVSDIVVRHRRQLLMSFGL